MPPSRTIAIARSAWEDRVVLAEDGTVVEIEIERRGSGLRPGDIYAGRLRRVVNGLDAAFVDLGDERPAYLALTTSERARLGALTKGRALVVQVVKAPLGGKGARLSSRPVLTSACWVLNTGGSGVAVSRRITEQAERERLRSLGARLATSGHGWVARTASAGRSDATLEHEGSQLLARWREIEAVASRVAPPVRLLTELDLPFRWLRDRLDAVGTHVTIAGTDLAEEVDQWLTAEGPRESAILEVDSDPGRVMTAIGADRALREALARVVRLPSGGHLTIDPTEALTAVDVDTGRSAGARNLEQTILATNLEAARAIARQLRLRNVGGIVVIDFIDMATVAHRERVLNELRAAVAADPAPIEILPFTSLGLVQLTRKRTRPSLDEIHQADCPDCGGTGRVSAAAAIGARALLALESRLAENERVALVVRATPAVAAWLRRDAAVAVQALERRLGRAIIVRSDDRVAAEFVVEPPKA